MITLLEPKLFKLTIGLDVHDFDLLCSLNVFNAETMNQAIWQFKRYEDSSLGYTGINRHAGDESVGGWDTVIRCEEFEAMFNAQQNSMTAPKLPEARPAVVSAPAPKAPEPAAARDSKQEKPAAPGYTTPTYYSSGRFGTPVRPAQPEKPKVDISGIVPGTLVSHKTFGVDTVLKIDKAQKYIHIRFAGGTKQFVFPDAFENGYLKKNN